MRNTVWTSPKQIPLYNSKNRRPMNPTRNTKTVNVLKMEQEPLESQGPSRKHSRLNKDLQSSLFPHQPFLFERDQQNPHQKKKFNNDKIKNRTNFKLAGDDFGDNEENVFKRRLEDNHGNELLGRNKRRRANKSHKCKRINKRFQYGVLI